MTLRSRLALRYFLIVGVCILLLMGLAYHEFVVEPRVRMQMGIPKPSGSSWGEYAEIVFHALIPVTLGVGWWFLRKTLMPIDTLAKRVEGIHPSNLNQPLPRSGNGDEVDRLTAKFNDMAIRLNHAFQNIREFTLHASHELKTPLTIMRAELGAGLREAETLSSSQRNMLLSLLEEVQRLTRIVDGLTLLTKADSGLAPIGCSPVNLSHLVIECFNDALTLAENYGVTATLSECDDIMIQGDKDRLRQLLLNLTDNAVKYNKAGGTVALALKHSDTEARFTITNTGPGIPSDLLVSIFDRFVRGQEARKRCAEGCGLGLPICQWIVKAHGGTIEVSSEPGLSTTFTVKLPIMLTSPLRSAADKTQNN